VRAGVAARLGHDPFSPEAESTLRCEVSGGQGRRHARIELRDMAGRTLGRRVLTSARNDCAELGPALLIVIASASATGGMLEAPEPGPGRAKVASPRGAQVPDGGASMATERRAPDEPARQPAGIQEPAPAQALERDRPMAPLQRPPAAPADAQAGSQFVPGVAGGITLGSGTGPAPAWAGVLAVGVRYGWRSLALEAFGTLPASMAVGGGRISEYAAGASLVPCLRYRALAACAVGKAGVLFGRGEGLPAARSAHVPWAAVGARAAWRLAFTARLALELRAEGLVLPTHTTVNAAGTVAWTTPRWAWNGGAAIVVELGRRPEERKMEVPAGGQ